VGSRGSGFDVVPVAAVTHIVPERLETSMQRRLAHFLEENGTLVIIVGAFALVLLTRLPKGLASDSWMALVSGREIVRHGLPSHDALTVWAHGRRWVDQQWFAQLLFYGLWRVGGLKLALLVHVALSVGALAGAAALARRLGASARSTTWICLPVLIAYYPGAAVMRPQSFAYPLFVAVFWLLATDARSPSRRVLATLPLLVLWANLHGSVLLGAALISLAGITALWRELSTGSRRVSRRYLALTLLAWPCVLVSPYALQLPAYYKTILGGRGFSHVVTEWAPTRLDAVTLPVYLLAFGGAWLLGRTGSRLSAFEKLAFLAMTLLAFQAVRNVVWFALVALAVLPLLLDSIRSPAAEPRRLNRLLATAVAICTVLAIGGAAASAQSWFAHDFPPAAAASAAAAAGHDGKILTTSPFADWLLWRHDELAGRVAYDTRFELLTSAELKRIARFLARAGDWKATTSGYRVFVLDQHEDAKLRTALVRSGIARVVLVDHGVVVLRRGG
jgi:hypothetical protein